jgi:hypothetical protein
MGFKNFIVRLFNITVEPTIKIVKEVRYVYPKKHKSVQPAALKMSLG